jgi:histidine triad (HIT) family protein
MPETVFAKIIRGEIPCARVYEDDFVFAFMDAGQVNPGHVLVATRAPKETILDLDDAEIAALFTAAGKVARAVQRAFEPAGITLLQANKPAGWQTVPHVHVHVVPRHEDDGVGLKWRARIRRSLNCSPSQQESKSSSASSAHDRAPRLARHARALPYPCPSSAFFRSASTGLSPSHTRNSAR